MEAPERLTAVFPRTAVFDHGRLVAIGGLEVGELAARFGTPLYVLDRDELLGRMRAYRAAFGADANVAYGSKALCVVGVLQLAAREGLYLDVASRGELYTAAQAGFPMERVLLHGNNKSAEELAEAVRLGVGRIVVDSFDELDRLSALAGSDAAIPVLVRVTPGVEAHTHEFIRTGHDDTKFGFTLSAGLAAAAAEDALARPGVALRGLHCHIGSQVLAVDAFDAAVEAMVGLLAQLRARRGETLTELNLGGGLGVAHTREEQALSVDAYATAVREAVAKHTAAHDLPAPRITVEPGRSIVGPAGVTLYTVGTVKEIPQVRTYVSVDGGMSDNPRPALYGARYEFVPAGPGGPVEPARRTTVAGLHCESGDVLARDIELPRSLTVGELLAVGCTGAYTAAMASNYNRTPRPPVVLVADGEARELVRRERLEDVVARDVPLELD